MSNYNILVIGDIMLDHYIFGKCERISPEAPVPIVFWEKEESSLGGAANLARNLVSLGINTKLISVLGNDEIGNQIENKTEANNLESYFIKSENRHSTLKTRIISGNHQISRFDRETREIITDSEINSLIDNVTNSIDKVDLILISDYNKGVISDKLINNLMAVAKKFKIPVFVDPKSNDFSKYKGVDLIKPNKLEAELATNIKIVDEKTLSMACAKISSITESEVVIVTLSQDGVALYENSTLTIIPTKAKEILDVTGAGDTFFAALSYFILKDPNYFEACKFANYASAVVIAKSGCQVVTFEEIIKLKNSHE
jgi:D-beta-D-heptose 7-phosphate kinase/D-beta-D-heptose 1-phosphate adenosyltransferase